MSDNNINVTAPLHAATKQGKLASAMEVFMDGDKETLQQIGDKTHQLENAVKDITATGGASTANAVSYSNETSGITAVTAQGAIDELVTKNKSQDTIIAKKAEKSDVQSSVSELKAKNTLQDAEIAKKANSADVTSQMRTEQTRVNAELDKKFNLANITQESGESVDKVMSQKVVSNKLSDLSEKAGYYAQISNWCHIVVDKDKRILGGYLKDGSFEFLKGIPSPIKKELEKKIDTKDGFCLIEKEVADSIQYKNNSYLYAICDALTRLLFYFDKNANCHCSKDLSVGGIINASGLSENLINYIKERTVDESYPIFVSGENDAAYTIVGKGSDGAKNNMNVSVGYQNLRYNTGTKNVAIGNQNLMFNSANGVVAIGYHSLFRNTTGYDNCCVGAESCDDNITGYSNTAFGNYSLQRNNNGSENTAIGRYAMNGNERDEEGKPGSAFDKNNGNLSCNRNTAVGCEALFNIRNGGKNIAIGYQASMNLVNYFNTIVIGNEVSPTDNNQIIIGTSQHKEVRIAGKKILFGEDGTVKWVE